jgi:hypothetical protein
MSFPGKLVVNVTEDQRVGPAFLSLKELSKAPLESLVSGDDGLIGVVWYVQAPDHDTREALQTLMTTLGHTLTPEQRAAVRGWLGRTA